MNRLIRQFYLFALIFCGLCRCCIANDISSQQRISLQFQQTEISVILQALADYRHMNLILSDDIDIKQTIKLQDVTWQNALEIILKSAKLSVNIEDNILFIQKQPDPNELLAQQLLAQKTQEQQQPLNYLTLKIDHADLKSLQNTIEQQGLLSERGKVFSDVRTSSIIIHDLTKHFTEIKKLVETLDHPLPQIHISAHIVTMSDESLSELGIKWGYNGKSSQLINQFDVGLGVASPSTSIGFNLAKRSGSLLNLELSALESENQLEIIASPNLLTSHQQLASIKQGTEIPYEVSSGSNGATSIEFKQAVLGLEVTPKVLTNDQLLLDLYITQNNEGRTIKRSDGGEALAIDTQEIKTQVLVKNGETIVLGGIFQQVNGKDNSRVPGLSKIPLVGGLFKYDGSKTQRRELVIFITPQLIY